MTSRLPKPRRNRLNHVAQCGVEVLLRIARSAKQRISRSERVVTRLIVGSGWLCSRCDSLEVFSGEQTSRRAGNDSAGTFADAERGTIDDIVDIERYPIDRPGSPPSRQSWISVELRWPTKGVARSPGSCDRRRWRWPLPSSLRLSPKADVREEFCSVYVRGDSEAELASDDPRGRILRRRVGHITRDQIAPDSVVHRLYVSPALKAFIAACVGEVRVFEYADPLAALIATVLPPGGTLPWHYDTNEFVVTILTQEPEAGGCSSSIRTCDGRATRTSTVSPGCSTTTLPRRCARATCSPATSSCSSAAIRCIASPRSKVSRERHVAVLSYANRPGVIGPIDRTRAVYGRVTEAHVIAHEISQGADGLIL